MKISLGSVAASVAIGCIMGSAPAALVWDEAVNGAVSNNRMAPTPVAVAAGMNTFRGSLTGDLGQGKYHDYITFQVPPKHALTGFAADAVTSPNSGAMIVGIAAGTIFPSDPNGVGIDKTIGWTGVSPASAGRDFFAQLAVPNNKGYGNSGFENFLPAGAYSFWVQDYNTPATYQFSFRIEKAVAPTIKVRKKRIGRNKASISGSATGTGTTVSYRVGTKGPFKSARGKAPEWTFTATKLKKGANTVTIRATGFFGVSTKTETVVIK